MPVCKAVFSCPTLFVVATINIGLMKLALSSEKLVLNDK